MPPSCGTRIAPSSSSPATGASDVSTVLALGAGGAAIIVLVVNNGMYGTIRMHQERRYPGRVSSTDLANPDFVALARSFGAYGERVSATEDFTAAFGRAQSAGGPALLELCVDPAQITPAARLAVAKTVGV